MSGVKRSKHNVGLIGCHFETLHQRHHFSEMILTLIFFRENVWNVCVIVYLSLLFVISIIYLLESLSSHRVL